VEPENSFVSILTLTLSPPFSLFLLARVDWPSKFYEALKSRDELDEAISLCRKNHLLDVGVNQFLDKLNIHSDGEVSTGDRLTAFQTDYARVAYPELSASCWKLLDTLARVVPDFRVDTGSSIGSVSSSNIQPPSDSSLQTFALYAVLDGMAQCAIARRLDGDSFESESNKILNCNLEGYQHVLQRFVEYVARQNRTHGNTDTISSGPPVGEQMTEQAVHALIGHMDRSNNYDNEKLFDEMQGQIFHFKI